MFILILTCKILIKYIQQIFAYVQTGLFGLVGSALRVLSMIRHTIALVPIYCSISDIHWSNISDEQFGSTAPLSELASCTLGNEATSIEPASRINEWTSAYLNRKFLAKSTAADALPCYDIDAKLRGCKVCVNYLQHKGPHYKTKVDGLLQTRYWRVL